MASPPQLIAFSSPGSGAAAAAALLARRLLGPSVRAAVSGSPASPTPELASALAELGIEAQPVGAVPATAADRVVVVAGSPPVGPAPDRLLCWHLPAGALARPQDPRELAPRARLLRDHLHIRLVRLARDIGIVAGQLGGRPPTVAVVGWKNAGKTTLVCRLVEALTARGFQVATLKATHHEVEPDPPGKDSWRHRRSGSTCTALVGGSRTVVTWEAPLPLARVLGLLEGADIVVVEGLRSSPLPKIEVRAPGSARPLLARRDPRVRAVASDQPCDGLELPVVPRDDIERLADLALAIAGVDPR